MNHPLRIEERRANSTAQGEERSANHLPQVLIPFDVREAIDLKTAARVAGKSSATIRDWAARLDIGRRVGGGNWMVSLPALQMHLDGDKAALTAYLRGDRESPGVVAYFERAGISLPLCQGVKR